MFSRRSARLSVSVQNISKRCELILMKFLERSTGCDSRTNHLDFGGDPDLDQIRIRIRKDSLFTIVIPTQSHK